MRTPMIRSARWLAVSLVASLAFTHAAIGQQSPPQTSTPAKPKPAKPAPKHSPPKPDQEPAAVAGAEPALLGQYGEWSAYVAQTGASKICFALAIPGNSQTKPATTARDRVYFFIATRPAENVRNEVSVMIGYAFKPGVEASVEIGPAKFAMYTQNDGAWIKNAAEESRLIETMRKGTDLIVTGTSSRGTQSVDRYSLKGLSQALDRTARECSATPTARGR